MADEIKEEVQEVVESGEAPKVEAITMEQVQELLAKDRDELNRKWQSKVDKIISEKKETEQKAMTVEEQIAELKREREQEKLKFARDSARQVARIDDDLDEAIASYASSDPDNIRVGAVKLRELIDAKAEALAAERFDELQKSKFTGKPPVSGKPVASQKSEEIVKKYNNLMAQGRTQEAMMVWLENKD